MTDLAARLAEAKGNDSIDAIVDKAAKAGHEINRATVARYIKGEGAKTPPDEVLRALAAGLSLDVRELRELAGMPRGELGEWTPPVESARLNEDQRKALSQLIKTIVAGKESGDGDAATKTEAEGTSAKKASKPPARHSTSTGGRVAREGSERR